MSSEMNRWWIPAVDINKKVIVSEIQYYLGPEATVRQYTYETQDGYLITTPGECLTDEQVDDICRKSREVWEKQAAARSQQESDKELKRPLHQPILISRNSRFESSASRPHQYSDEKWRGGDSRNGERSRR